MAQVIVRNLPDDVVAGLKAREDMIAEIDRIRAMTPRKLQSDSTDLIREDRDRGWD